MEHLQFLTQGWTPGGVGIWLILGSLLLGMWKGLPAVLDSWSNSVSKERDHREKEIARLETQIKSADDRHEDCMQGQKALRDEMSTMKRSHAEEIAELQKLISGMVLQMRQMQLSAIGGTISPPLPDAFSQMLRGIEKGKA